MSSVTCAAATAKAPLKTNPSVFSEPERERLILEHLPQVRLIAARIHEHMAGLMSLEDMVSHGTIGLIAAIDRFDPAQGVKLKTYAEFKIRGAILDSLRELDWAPRSQRRRARAIVDAQNEVENRTQAVATVEDIAGEMGISLAECHQWLSETRQVSFESIDASGAGFEEGASGRQIASTDAEAHPERAVELKALREVLIAAIERMPKQEKIVLSLVFHEELSLREIARVMGLHESRVSQIRSQALARMRKTVAEMWPMRGKSGRKASEASRRTRPCV